MTQTLAARIKVLEDAVERMLGVVGDIVDTIGMDDGDSAADTTPPRFRGLLHDHIIRIQDSGGAM